MRSSDSSAATAPARPRPCGSHWACSPRTRARCAGTAQPVDPGDPQPDRLHAQERGLYPRMKVGEQLGDLAGLDGMSAGDAVAASAGRPARPGRPGRGRRAEAEPGQSAAAATRGGLVHQPEVLVRRAVLRPDPVAVDVISEVLREVADPAYRRSSPATSWTWSNRLRPGRHRPGRPAGRSGSVDGLPPAARRGWSWWPRAPTELGRPLPGVTVLEQSGTRTVLARPAGADDQCCRPRSRPGRCRVRPAAALAHRTLPPCGERDDGRGHRATEEATP